MIKTTKQSDVVRSWHLIDVKGETLGRIATKIAQLLVGKSKSYFTRSLDCGDHVVVINAVEVKVTGKKETDKVYTRYSGYPGGLSSIPLGKMRLEHPENIIRLAVKGMVPNNKLRDIMMTRLHVYKNNVHPYTDKFK